MNRRSITFTLLLTGLCVVLLWVSLGGMTLTAQGDPTAQQETVNAIVNARFTQTAQVLQERTITMTAMTATAGFEATVQRQFELNLTATANLEATVNAQIAGIQRTNVAATLAAGGIVLVTANSQWTPQEQDFDGVTMVLVPPGCFKMGSEDGDDDEKPAHEVCFDQPFWIDKTEVTNGQFVTFKDKAGSESAWTAADRPREQINWYEAALYCGVRGARLPSEAEWEYAARGPDSLIYPWGNEFVADYVVYGGNSKYKTAAVGSRRGGVSWVGALDMSGNVWEWTNTIYQPYPYKADDGRESTSDTNSSRVLRGGDWYDDGYGVRASIRDGYTPNSRGINLGFRCARSYN